MKWEPVNDLNRSCLGDESRMTGRADSICFPESAAEAEEAFCAAVGAGEKITLQGSRTGLMGGAVPDGGKIINLSKCKKTGNIVKAGDEYRIFAEAGVTLEEIEGEAGKKHLFFPPNPTENTATLGGIFASGGGGPSALHYGNTARYVRTLDWLTPEGKHWHIVRGDYQIQGGKLPLPDGKLLDLAECTGLPFAFWQEGWDLIDFLAGSEGYFGAALSMELKLLPEPGDRWALMFFFEQQPQALAFGESLRQWKNEHASDTACLTAAEFYDQSVLELLRQHSHNPLLSRLAPIPAGVSAAVYAELESPGEDASAEALMALLDAFEACGGRENHSWAENGPGAIRKFRNLRHAIPAILNEMAGICRSPEGIRWEAGFAGPDDRAGEFINLYHGTLANEELSGAVYGHLLKNSLHLVFLHENPEQEKKSRKILEKMADKVLNSGGILISEYGMGRINLPLVLARLTERQREALRKIRLAFDPNETMNP